MQNTAGRILRQMRIEIHQSERRVTDQSARRTPSRDRWKGAEEAAGDEGCAPTLAGLQLSGRYKYPSRAIL